MSGEKLILFEMKCTNTECGKISLQELKYDSNSCPYCEEDTDYAPGKREPVLLYTPRHLRGK